MSALPPHDYRHLLQVEAAALAQAGADPDRFGLELPHLKGWTIQSVIGHTAWTLRFARLALEGDPENPPSRSSVPEPPPSDELLAWYQTACDELLAALDAVDPDKPCPTFTGTQDARWWFRRMAHEVSIHRWDVESAFTSPNPIDPAQAKDGIDELLDIYANRRMQFPVLDGKNETIHLHATDIDDGEWMLTLGPESISWTHGHAKGDVAARGPISDLLLMMWSRIPAARLDLIGDSKLIERWQEAANF